MAKAKVSFLGTDAELLTSSKTICNSLKTLEIFQNKPEQVPSVDMLQEAIDRFQKAYEGGKNGDRIQIALRKKARAELTAILKTIALYL